MSSLPVPTADDVTDPSLIGVVAKLGLRLGFDLAKEMAQRAGRAWEMRNWEEFGVDDTENLPITSYLVAKPAKKVGEVIGEREASKAMTKPGPAMTSPKKATPPPRKRKRGWKERTVQHP